MALPTLNWNPLRTSRFDPLAEIEDMFRSSLGARSLSREYEKTLEMRMDVHEDENLYRVTVEVPGVRKEDIDVAVEGNQVTITAEVKHEQARDTEKEVHRERFTGKAYRSFTLPTNVDVSKSEARYDGGVLNLTLPKLGETRSKHLSIN